MCFYHFFTLLFHGVLRTTTTYMQVDVPLLFHGVSRQVTTYMAGLVFIFSVQDTTMDACYLCTGLV